MEQRKALCLEIANFLDVIDCRDLADTLRSRASALHKKKAARRRRTRLEDVWDSAAGGRVLPSPRLHPTIIAEHCSQNTSWAIDEQQLLLQPPRPKNRKRLSRRRSASVAELNETLALVKHELKAGTSGADFDNLVKCREVKRDVFYDSILPEAYQDPKERDDSSDSDDAGEDDEDSEEESVFTTQISYDEMQEKLEGSLGEVTSVLSANGKAKLTLASSSSSSSNDEKPDGANDDAEDADVSDDAAVSDDADDSKDNSTEEDDENDKDDDKEDEDDDKNDDINDDENEKVSPADAEKDADVSSVVSDASTISCDGEADLPGETENADSEILKALLLPSAGKKQEPSTSQDGRPSKDKDKPDLSLPLQQLKAVASATSLSSFYNNTDTPQQEAASASISLQTLSQRSKVGKSKHQQSVPVGTTKGRQMLVLPKYEHFHLRIVSERARTGLESSPQYSIEPGKIVAGRYKLHHMLGKAAFSRAVCAEDLLTSELVSVKIIENNKEYVDQSLDEIKVLTYLNKSGDPDEHRVLRLLDYFYYKEHLFIVTELLRENLYEFYRFSRLGNRHEGYFTLPRLKKIARQVLQALSYAHRLEIIHCDLKPENILLVDYGSCTIKVIDFGSSCFTGDHLGSYVQSRAYRAPEVILGYRYGPNIDIWSLGCILFELLTGRVLFVNESVQHLLARIVAVCGPVPKPLLRAKYYPRFFNKDGNVFERVPRNDLPSKYLIYHPCASSLTSLLSTYSSPELPLFIHFLQQLILFDPTVRPTAEQALEHPWLQS